MLLMRLLPYILLPRGMLLLLLWLQDLRPFARGLLLLLLVLVLMLLLRLLLLVLLILPGKCILLILSCRMLPSRKLIRQVLRQLLLLVAWCKTLLGCLPGWYIWPTPLLSLLPSAVLCVWNRILRWQRLLRQWQVHDLHIIVTIRSTHCLWLGARHGAFPCCWGVTSVVL